jgi:hypothetical protein
MNRLKSKMNIGLGDMDELVESKYKDIPRDRFPYFYSPYLLHFKDDPEDSWRHNGKEYKQKLKEVRDGSLPAIPRKLKQYKVLQNQKMRARALGWEVMVPAVDSCGVWAEDTVQVAALEKILENKNNVKTAIKNSSKYPKKAIIEKPETNHMSRIEKMEKVIEELQDFKLKVLQYFQRNNIDLEDFTVPTDIAVLGETAEEDISEEAPLDENMQEETAVGPAEEKLSEQVNNLTESDAESTNDANLVKEQEPIQSKKRNLRVQAKNMVKKAKK